LLIEKRFLPDQKKTALSGVSQKKKRQMAFERVPVSKLTQGEKNPT